MLLEKTHTSIFLERHLLSWSTARWWIPCWDSNFGFFIFVNDKLVTETFIIWLIFGIRLPNWGRIRNFWLLIFGARATTTRQFGIFVFGGSWLPGSRWLDPRFRSCPGVGTCWWRWLGPALLVRPTLKVFSANI